MRELIQFQYIKVFSGYEEKKRGIEIVKMSETKRKDYPTCALKALKLPHMTVAKPLKGEAHADLKK